MRRCVIAPLVVLVVCVALCERAYGVIIFDNLAPTGTGYTADPTEWLALRFTTDTTHLTLTSVTLPLSVNASFGYFNLLLYPDNGGQPGFDPVADLFGGNSQYPGLNGVTNDIVMDGFSVAMNPDTNYWLVLTEYGGNAFFGWGINPSGPTTGTGSDVSKDEGLHWSSVNGSATSGETLMARIEAIPEPSTLCLTLTGILTACLMCYSRRYKA